MATCNVNDLLAQACENEFNCLDEGQQRAVLLSLLCDLAAGGTGGGAVWGEITGTLSAQTDLQAALDAKLNLSGGTMTGNLLFTDNSFDIGASGATRPRTGYFGTSVVTPLVTILPGANATAETISGYSLTGANAQGMVAMAGTWNTSGTPTAIDLNITDTASNAASLLMTLRRGGATQHAVTKFGQVQAGDGATALTAGTPGFSFVGAPAIGFRRISTTGMIFCASAADIWFSAASSLVMRSNGMFAFSATTDPSGSADVTILRDAAETLALRRATNAQVFRWYRTFSTTSDYERGALQTAAGQIIIAAETAGSGTDDIDVTLTPAGAGLVRFGTVQPILGLLVTGYIPMKDAGGTIRNIAVVS